MTTLATGKGASQITLSPVFFVLLQTLLLFVATSFAAMLATNAEKKAANQAAKLDKKITETEREITKLENEIGSIPERVLHSEITRSETAAQNSSMQARICSYYAQAVAAYAESNNMWHSGGLTIDVSQAIPEL